MSLRVWLLVAVATGAHAAASPLVVSGSTPSHESDATELAAGAPPGAVTDTLSTPHQSVRAHPIHLRTARRPTDASKVPRRSTLARTIRRQSKIISALLARELALVEEVCSTSDAAAKEARNTRAKQQSQSTQPGLNVDPSAQTSVFDRDKVELKQALEELHTAAHQMVKTQLRKLGRTRGQVKAAKQRAALLDSAATKIIAKEVQAQKIGAQVLTRSRQMVQSLQGDAQFASPDEAKLIHKFIPCLHTVLASQSGVDASKIKAAAQSLRESISRDVKALNQHVASPHVHQVKFVEARETLAAAVLRVEASVNKMARVAAQLQQENDGFRVPHLKHIAKMIKVRREGTREEQSLKSMQTTLNACIH